jgi:hypothetical protein
MGRIAVGKKVFSFVTSEDNKYSYSCDLLCFVLWPLLHNCMFCKLVDTNPSLHMS